jgi:hypothetical protein
MGEEGVEDGQGGIGRQNRVWDEGTGHVMYDWRGGETEGGRGDARNKDDDYSTNIALVLTRRESVAALGDILTASHLDEQPIGSLFV